MIHVGDLIELKSRLTTESGETVKKGTVLEVVAVADDGALDLAEIGVRHPVLRGVFQDTVKVIDMEGEQQPDHGMEELTGTVARLIYVNDEQSFAVVLLKEDGQKITCKGDVTKLVRGLPYRFVGTWEHNDRYGRQFQAVGFIAHEPQTKHGIVTYLTNSCEGIGRVTAEKLFAKYGQAAVDTLKNEPKRAAAEVGIKIDIAENASDELRRSQKFQETRIALMGLLKGYGFPDSLYDAAINKFGAAAAKRIERDPFTMLVNRLPGAGFLRCDRLYTELGYPLDRLKRQTVCAWHAMEADMDGSAWFRREWIAGELRKKVTGNVKPSEAIRLGVKAKVFCEHEDSDGQRWIATRAAAQHETTISERLGVLL